MEDKSKQLSSFQLDQEILDARGIKMTVAEVAGLSTTEYSTTVQLLHLSEEDMAFLKCLRRRIKNRLASQNSRKRSVEHLRKLNKELRAVRACKGDALAERRAIIDKRDRLIDSCHRLRGYIDKVLNQRGDTTPLPIAEFTEQKITATTESHRQLTKDIKKEKEEMEDQIIKYDHRIDKIVNGSLNDFYNGTIKSGSDMKTVKALLAREPLICDVKTSNNAYELFQDGVSRISCESSNNSEESECGILNLSLKSVGRRTHGRKQSAPRRLPVYCDNNDESVLDLKIKKEN